jgi:transposase
VARLPNRSAGAAPPRRPRGRSRKPNDLRFEGTAPVFRALGVDLTAVEGIDVPTALVLLGEVGADVSKFPTEKHFTSWLGLCPNTQRSLHHSQPAPGSFYRRMRSRLGPKGAITATAHKLAR